MKIKFPNGLNYYSNTKIEERSFSGLYRGGWIDYSEYYRAITAKLRRDIK
jgi:hypothetical protein